MATDTTTEQTAEQTAAPAQPELTVVDLQNLKSIIDVAAQRGAFRAGEMEAVGGQYNKLTKFLEAVAPQQPADQTPAA